MRVLVTGGAGFISSYLCEALLNQGNEVICIDNLINGSLKNIESLFKKESFCFIKQDVTNYIYTGKLDFVFHFASPASPKDYLDYPLQTLKAGALGMHKILRVAKEKGATYILASTSEVYGDPLVHPQGEDYWGNVNPIGPRGVYDEAKRFAEAMTMAYYSYHGVDMRIARIFNTYGPLRGEPLTVFGDGSQTRSFYYISNMIEEILKLMKSNINEPINLGNPS